MLEQLRSGDVVEVIRERSAGFRSLAEDIDTTTSTGRLIFHVFGSIAEFERIAERTREALAAAKRRVREPRGRPRALSTDQQAEVRRMRDEEERPVMETARLFKVSGGTVSRA